jgi:flavin-dependent dehydrogenase
MTAKTIKILGAGPAGLTAAINLTQAGYHVDVFEKRSDTGKRFHGDVQGLENWSGTMDVMQECEAMNLCLNFDHKPLLQQVVTNGKKIKVSHYTDKPLCYLVKRGTMAGSLDQGLKEQALAAGVQIHFSETVPEETADIVATGPISKEIFAVDKGIIFETSCQEEVAIFLANDAAAYKGYAYLFIHDGFGCLCTVLFDNFTQLDDCFQTSQQMFAEMVDFDVQDPSPVSGVGSFSSQNVYQRGQALYVGEAAGLQDLFMGFGIRTALVSGYTAAKAIIEGTNYAQTAEQLFNARLKATVVNRFLWEILRHANYGAVVDRKDTQESLSISALYSFPRWQKWLYPMARWVVQRRYPNLRL